MPFFSFFLNKLIQAFSSAFFDRFSCYFLIIKLSFVTTFNAVSIVSYNKLFAASRAETCTFEFLEVETSSPLSNALAYNRTEKK